MTAGEITGASSSTVSAGVVLSQDPVAGTRVSSGTPVGLVVSSGPAVAVEGEEEEGEDGSDVVEEEGEEDEPDVGPVLALSKTEMDFGETPTGDTVRVYNAGTGTLEWVAEVEPANVEWVGVNIPSGTGSTTVLVTADRDRMAKSEASVVFRALNGAENEERVQVSALKPEVQLEEGEAEGEIVPEGEGMAEGEVVVEGEIEEEREVCDTCEHGDLDTIGDRGGGLLDREIRGDQGAVGGGDGNDAVGGASLRFECPG